MATTTLPYPLPRSPLDVYYPESDGRPMAESDVHARCILDARFALENWFASQLDVYVSGNLLIYYQEGDPRACCAPDVFVIRGVRKVMRGIYRLWEEKIAPQFVLEVTSRSTRTEDLGGKRGTYEVLGVQEYVLFDPLGDYLVPRLQAYRLVDGRYEPTERLPEGGVASEVLALELQVHGGDLRFYDPAARQLLPTPSEETVARRAAEARASSAERRMDVEAAARLSVERRLDAEAAARREAEDRAAEALAELARLRAQLERQSRSG